MSPTGQHFDGSSQMNKAKAISMSPSGHSYNLGTSVTKSVPLGGYSREGDSSPKSYTEETLLPSSGHLRDGSSLVNNTQKPSMLRSGNRYDLGTSVTKSVPLSGHHHDDDSSPKNNSQRTLMPPSGHCYDGSSSVNSIRKTSMSPIGDHSEIRTSVVSMHCQVLFGLLRQSSSSILTCFTNFDHVHLIQKTSKTPMLLSGHRQDGVSSSAKNSQMPPMVSKEHRHEVNASLVNSSKRTGGS